VVSLFRTKDEMGEGKNAITEFCHFSFLQTVSCLAGVQQRAFYLFGTCHLCGFDSAISPMLQQFFGVENIMGYIGPCN